MNLSILQISVRKRGRYLLSTFESKYCRHVSCIISNGSTKKHLAKLGPDKQIIDCETWLLSRSRLNKTQSLIRESFAHRGPREFRTFTASNLCYAKEDGSLLKLIDKMSVYQTASFTKKRNKQQQRPKQSIGTFSLQVIGTGSLECPPSILVIANSNRYLFNCGEGVQRLLMENGVKNISRLEHVFLTKMHWENIGGLIGMTITLKNIGLPKVYYHGPPNMQNFVDALQIFAKHETINISLRPYTDGVFETEYMKVTPVAIFENQSESNDSVQTTTRHSESTSDSIESSGRTTPSKATSPDVATTTERSPDDRPTTLSDVVLNMNVKQSLPSAKKKRSSPNLTVAYICKVPKRTRSVIIEKALALGLPPGPKYTELKNGFTVKTESGQEVNPDDVLGPDIPSHPFIVLQCPSINYLDSLCQNEALQRCQAGDGEDSARFIIHITPSEVIQHPRYKDWMKRFHPEAEHLIVNNCQVSASHESARGLQAKLNLMHPQIFPLLYEPKRIDLGLDDNSLKVVQAETYMRYHIYPPTGVDRSLVPTLNTEPYIKEAKEMEHFLEDLDTFKASEGSGTVQKETVKYPEVVFLGTGSAMPNKERNVSCVMLNLSKDQSMILDAGEGSFAQMFRFYGSDLDDVLFNVQCIFISHMHADHHAGLIKILKHWKNVVVSRGAEDKDLLLVGPKRLLIWLNQYNQNCEDFIHKLRFVESGEFTKDQDNIPRHGQALLKKLKLMKFETVPVIHCVHAYGVAITHQDGWKFVYSGDTMPCEALVKAGMNADLLIHEATLEDGMEKDAQIKRHSMTCQAIDIGVQMKAKCIILTHFSQRYSKIPLFSDQFSDKVAVAFDNMKVSLSELHLLPKLVPSMKRLFAEELQELEEIRWKKIEKRSIPPDLIENENVSKKLKTT